MQTPKNRQEFLSMQQQAAAAARDMQRRATLPMPARDQGAGFRGQGERRPPEPAQPQFRPPEPLHHRSPSQQARQAASYGRMQPQMRQYRGQDTRDRRQVWSRPQPQQGRREPSQHSGQPQYQTPPQHQAPPRYRTQPGYQEDPRFREPPPPPPPPPSPPPPAANSMPPFADLLGMLGGLGGLGGASHKHEAGPESPFGAFASGAGGEGSEGGMDSMMMLLLLLLLRKENADQGLLMALMYIMM